MRNSYLIIVLCSFIIWTISCSGKPGTSSEKIPVKKNLTEIAPQQKVIKIISPEEGSDFKPGDIIKIGFEPENIASAPDSVVIYYNGKIISRLFKTPWTYNITLKGETKMGRNSIKLMAYRGNQQPQVITRFFTEFSDIIPKIFRYKVVNVYPHDRAAYTQGLVYDEGFLYEGTGLYGESDLRKVELKTGSVIKQQKIENQLFGEGVALMGDRIFQLTWTSKVGFVYEKSTFKLINKFNYQTEGWGLSVYNDKLVMSDGTNMLYFIDPDLLTVVSSIEVYDNIKQVNQLNELEVINGEIWANIYQSDMIARIDPATGKVLSYINLAGILPEADRDANTEVLNGIAWDKGQNRIFITGKHWSKLFEIRLVE